MPSKDIAPHNATGKHKTARKHANKSDGNQPRLPNARHFSQEIANQVLELVASGSNLTRIGDDTENGLPSSKTLFAWRKGNESFALDYTHAIQDRAEWRVAIIDDTLDKVISEQYSPHQARVIIDGHKWMAGCESPKYNDRVIVEQHTTITHIMPALEQFTAKIEAMAQRRAIIDITPEDND